MTKLYIITFTIDLNRELNESVSQIELQSVTLRREKLPCMILSTVKAYRIQQCAE